MPQRSRVLTDITARRSGTHGTQSPTLVLIALVQRLERQTTSDTTRCRSPLAVRFIFPLSMKEDRRFMTVTIGRSSSLHMSHVGVRISLTKPRCSQQTRNGRGILEASFAQTAVGFHKVLSINLLLKTQMQLHRWGRRQF